MTSTPEPNGTHVSSAGNGSEAPAESGARTTAESLAHLSDAERIAVLRDRARARRATGEIPERFGARVDQHFTKILQHVRPTDDIDDPLIAAASMMAASRSQAAAPVQPAADLRSQAKQKLSALGATLARSVPSQTDNQQERDRIEALEQTVLVLIERLRELERREHRVTALTDRVDELEWKVRKLRSIDRAARPPLPHEPEDLDDDSFDDDEYEQYKLARNAHGPDATGTDATGTDTTGTDGTGTDGTGTGGSEAGGSEAPGSGTDLNQ